MDTAKINEMIGSRIRDLRNRNGLTQQELADRTELTKGFISQLERGQVTPSVETLLDLIECLGTSPAEFFKEEKEEQVVFHEAEYFEKVDEGGNRTLWLVPPAQKFEMEPILVELTPHGSLEMDKPHAGEEFGYCLAGKLAVYLGDNVYHVRAGESFYYRTTVNHRVANPGSRPAKFLWISTPPQF
ncbi:MAG: cupin domain-containing protein [Lachnospiraceae bacterium]|jgi:transcriptional regulator with XRE-family HTH domain|nr:cupin domain-containing protein [Lachnospiraceae bacterium]MCI1398256.1 cupin domain-containing protein [Lachnospiraceae bacterium]